MNGGLVMPMHSNPYVESEIPKINDSGDRTKFDTGAVRDMRAGKGRFDLIPLGVMYNLLTMDLPTSRSKDIVGYIWMFMENASDYNVEHLYRALKAFSLEAYDSIFTMFLEVAKHFEEGAVKYGENNWQKGIPPHVYIDSALRHYMKWLRKDTDEPHDRAFVWNIMCCIWEVEFHTEEAAE